MAFCDSASKVIYWLKQSQVQLDLRGKDMDPTSQYEKGKNLQPFLLKPPEVGKACSWMPERSEFKS